MSAAAANDLRPFTRAWRRRFAEDTARRAVERDARHQAAKAVLPHLVAHLAQVHGVRQVLLTGSLARGDFDERSDIDLAVLGLPSDALLKTGAELERMAGVIPVDLVRIERAAPAYLRFLETEGRLLYAAGD